MVPIKKDVGNGMYRGQEFDIGANMSNTNVKNSNSVLQKKNKIYPLAPPTFTDIRTVINRNCEWDLATERGMLYLIYFCAPL